MTSGATRVWIVVGLVAGLMVDGFAARAQPATASPAAPAIGLEQMPWDAAMVIGASVLRMRGLDDAKVLQPVTFAPAAWEALLEPDFRYEEFNLVGVAVTDYAVLAETPAAFTLSALLKFADSVGRRADLSLVADYRFVGESLEVFDIAILPMTPPIPEVRLFFVPGTDVPPEVLDLGLGQLDRLRRVAEKAVSGQTLARPPAGPRDYYVFGFVFDRLPADAQVALVLSDQPDGIGGDSGNLVVENAQGFRIAVMRGSFPLNVGPELFFKAVYQPGGDVPPEERTPRLAAVFSNHLAAEAAGGPGSSK